ncbi:MAG: sulfatase-like hydrolase/transferase, partial [Chitinivibrionales bacterium]|nr:sulfatase-like hydrolase/transferase [Chitinivibrionales bacterium]
GTEEYPSLEAYPTLQDLDFWRTFDEPFYGFDHVELARNHTDEAHVGQHYALWLEEKGCKNWRDYFRPPTGTNASQDLHWEIPEEYHYDAWIAERTQARLKECAANDTPFFIWASFFDPHPSYLAPSPWDTMYDPDKVTVPHITEGEHEKNPPHFGMTQEKSPDFSAYQEPQGNGMHGFGSHLTPPDRLRKEIAVYYGMVSLMDKYIGRILDTLDELGLTDSTLVVFTTDHGHFFGQHGLTAKGPFHYEDLVKVPLIASMPGLVPEGRHSGALQSLVDLPPTMLDLLAMNIPRHMTGRSQKEVWCGNAERLRDNVIVENRHQPTTVFHRTLINDRYKLTVYYNRSYGELFDLQEDHGEVTNLWDSPEAQALKSSLLLEFMHATMGTEPLPMPRIAGA